jgi:AbrB family looped-hinge helix DNA binding protein
METTRLSTKGQIVLPLGIRTSRAWKPGTRFTVEETREGILLRPASDFPATTLDEVAGCLSRIRKAGKRKAVTLTEMDAGIAEEVARRHALGRY